MKLLDNGALLLTRAEFDALPEYSMSLPTGTTPGKAWKRRVIPRAPKDRAEWRRGVYGLPYPDDHEFAGQIPIGWRAIVIEGRAPFFPFGVAVAPPVMRGRITGVPIAEPEPRVIELPDGLWKSDGGLWFSCRSCGHATEWEADAAVGDSIVLNDQNRKLRFCIASQGQSLLEISPDGTVTAADTVVANEAGRVFVESVIRQWGAFVSASNESPQFEAAFRAGFRQGEVAPHYRASEDGAWREFQRGQG